MKPIGSLFEKYQKVLRPPQATVEKEAQTVIKQITTITIPLEQISYNPSTRTLKLTTPSVVRSELMKQKPTILAAIQKTLGATHAPTELI